MIVSMIKVANCQPSQEVLSKGYHGLLVEVVEARGIYRYGKQLLYSSLGKRNFNCILNYTNLPPNVKSAEFHTQTDYALMDSETHQVTWNEVFDVGTIYDLDVNIKVRYFLACESFSIIYLRCLTDQIDSRYHILGHRNWKDNSLRLIRGNMSRQQMR
jgi:hypothetical protein